jgi:hypothetical protein
MFCIYCGRPIDPSINFCPYCGHARKVEPTTTTSDPALGDQTARKIRVTIDPPSRQQPPKETPEEIFDRIKDTSPIIHPSISLETQMVFVTWMMRGLFVAIALMVIYSPKSYLNWDHGIFTVFILIFSICGSEYFYYRSKMFAREARLSKDGLTLGRLSLYGGLIHSNEKTIPKDDIIKVEIGRARDAPPQALISAPAAGVPASFIIYLRGGKLLSLYKRKSEEIEAAAEYAEIVWKVAKGDMAERTIPSPELVYKEFINDHHSSNYRSFAYIAGASMVAFSIMGTWFLLTATKLATLVVSLVPFGLVAFMAVTTYIMYQQSYAVKRVRVEREGLALIFKNRTKHIQWSNFKGITMVRADAVSRGKDRVACIMISPKKFYIVKREIGEAIQQAYQEAMGREVPNGAITNAKPGAITADDANTLKYENPSLYRKNILLSIVIFINGIVLILNIAIGSRVLLLLCIVLLIVLMFVRLQTSKEIKEYLMKKNGGGRPPTY